MSAVMLRSTRLVVQTGNVKSFPARGDKDEEHYTRLCLVITSNMTSAPHHDSSLLLSLPRELRDTIYEYALTEDQELFKDAFFSPQEGSATGRFSTINNTTQNRDHNQLKYVCRQLYTETRGLSLRFNDLTFRGPNGPDLFHAFLTHECSPAHLPRLKHVLITNHSTLKRDTNLLPLCSSAVKSFCAAHPTVRVSVQMQNLHTDSSWSDWYLGGSAIQYTVRGTLPDVLPEALHAHCVGTRSVVMGKPFPQNLRVLPKGFDEEGFRRAHVREIGRLEKEYMEGWIGQFREWAGEGF
ncbi:hypothetical protein P153DRAFT_380827 [Dothidotthia symphoricarpi CBS 119687]|uniref:Uncharacterized protein n=1 Tax=Dothidotthia symphoricarpi CBS 119687 TaxID=1392245 RepID=A0A6A6AW34_9PLEO|nr:uncharacterized protein P153DRAFT_380827 [Dothidotthia symphoricarpi CBS 119687]KAF2135027.1 hypothetical protein P153DRAFT_380827 [Dothidotthia symphoricarpi CBS 119687]